MRALETRIPPPLVFLLAAVVMWIVAQNTFTLHLAPVWHYGLSFFFIALGINFILPAILAFRHHATAINPVHVDRASKLVTTGPFRHSRNPMYVGLLALLFGWACYLASPWALIVPILFELYILCFQIWPEERALLAKFGDEYRVYAGKVRRWI